MTTVLGIYMGHAIQHPLKLSIEKAGTRKAMITTVESEARLLLFEKDLDITFAGLCRTHDSEKKIMVVY